MPVSVWVDVGGTFTDCILHDSSGRRETKVLSSGRIPAAIKSVVDRHTIELQAIPAADTDRFWRSANVSILNATDAASRLGAIVDQRASTIRLDQPIPESVANANSIRIEIDAGIEAPVLATHLLLGVPVDQTLPATDLRMGTTRGTNALLTRQGASTGLLVTKGFADILRIGEQDRPDLFALSISQASAVDRNRDRSARAT